MKENDIIAEYVKEKYPELLTTCDFAMFKITVAARECCRSMWKKDFDAMFHENL